MLILEASALSKREICMAHATKSQFLKPRKKALILGKYFNFICQQNKKPKQILVETRLALEQ